MVDPELDPSPATSISTALLPSDSDDDLSEHLTPAVWVPPPRPPPLHPEPDRPALRRAALWAIVGFLALLLLPAALLSPPQVGSPPTSRKAASMGVFLGNPAALASKNPSPGGLNDTQEAIIVWAGMGHHRALLADAFAFDLRTRRWAKVLTGKKGGKEPQPDARWKAAAAVSTAPPGMMVLFGDDSGGAAAPTASNTSYKADVWVLNLPSLRWEAAAAGGGALATPAARRGHAAAVVPPPSAPGAPARQQEQRVVVFGGALPNRTNLDDTWIATVAWPALTWSQVGAGAARPPARRGHTATALDGAPGGPAEGVAVFGGRDGAQFFNDLWVLRNVSGGEAVWEAVELAPGSPAPPARAHHAAAAWRGRLHVWGGLAGPTFAAAKPLDDLWVFDFGTRRWTKAIGYGAQPLPRFLFSAATRGGGGGGGSAARTPQLYIFGGETYDRCKLNDVWALSLETLRWDLLAPNFFAKARCDRLFGGRGGGAPGRRRFFF